MNRFNKYLTRYLIFSFPFVVAIVIWFSLAGEMRYPKGTVSYYLYEALGWNIVLWFVALVYFFVSLIISSNFRELVITKLARIKERDERESYIVGKSTRGSFFATLSLIIFLLFFSGLQVTVGKKPSLSTPDGKTGYISLGYSFEGLDLESTNEKEENGILWNSHGFPISKQGILLLLLAWQLGSYYYFARKTQKE